MVDHPRARKVADRIKVIVAEYLEFRIKDDRLGFVTITDCRVTGDLQHATVFYTVFGSDEERQASADALPADSAHLEDVLAQTRARDAELARAAAGATYAGDPDPYKKPADETDADTDDTAGSQPATTATPPGAVDEDVQAR